MIYGKKFFWVRGKKFFWVRRNELNLWISVCTSTNTINDKIIWIYAELRLLRFIEQCLLRVIQVIFGFFF